MTALQATSNAVREEIIALEDQIADAKIEPLKNTARRALKGDSFICLCV